MSRTALIEAIFSLKEELTRRKAFVDDLKSEAKEMIQAGRYIEGEQKLKDLIELDGKNIEAWYELSAVYCTVRRYEDALNASFKALEGDPTKAAYHYGFGLILEHLNDTRQAIQRYRKAIDLPSRQAERDDSNGGPSEAEGLCSIESLYRQAAWPEPDYIGYLHLANNLLAQHKVVGAIEAYEAALRLQPYDPTILHNIGTAYKINNDPVKASCYFGFELFYQKRYQEAGFQFRNYLGTYQERPRSMQR